MPLPFEEDEEDLDQLHDAGAGDGRSHLDHPRNLAAAGDGENDNPGQAADMAVGGNNYIKVKPFSGNGDEDIISWLDRYEAFADGWNDGSKVAKIRAFLSGTAEKWFNVHVKGQGLTFDELKDAMKAQFLPMNYQSYLKQKLFTRKQKFDETVASFIIEIEDIIQRVDGDMPEVDKVNYLLNGMRPEIAKTLYAWNPQTVDEVAQHARQIERGLKAETARAMTGKTYGSNDMSDLGRSMAEIAKGIKSLVIVGPKQHRGPWSVERFPRPMSFHQKGQWNIPPQQLQTGFTQREAQPRSVTWQAPGPERPHGSLLPHPVQQTHRVPQMPLTPAQQFRIDTRTNTGRIKCYQCGGGHYVRFCPQIVADGATRGPQNNACLETCIKAPSTNMEGMIMHFVTIDDISTEAMVDSGSSVTVICEEFANKLHRTPEVWNGPEYSAINGSNVDAVGGLPVKITITDGKKTVTVKVTALVIADFPSDVLLGNDFNVKAGLVIDCGSRSIRLEDPKRKPQVAEKFRPSTTLFSKQSLTLPPRSRSKAMVGTNYLPHKRSSPVVNVLSVERDVLVSEGPVHLENGLTEVEVTNMSTLPKHFKQGSVMAAYQLVAEEKKLGLDRKPFGSINSMVKKANRTMVDEELQALFVDSIVSDDSENHVYEEITEADLPEEMVKAKGSLDLGVAIEDVFGHPVRMEWVNNPVYTDPPGSTKTHVVAKRAAKNSDKSKKPAVVPFPINIKVATLKPKKGKWTCRGAAFLSLFFMMMVMSPTIGKPLIREADKKHPVQMAQTQNESISPDWQEDDFTRGPIMLMYLAFFCTWAVALGSAFALSLAFALVRRKKKKNADQGRRHYAFTLRTKRPTLNNLAVRVGNADQESDMREELTKLDFGPGEVNVSAHLTTDQAMRLKQLLRRFQKTFAFSEEDVGYTNLFSHTIDTGDNPPIKLRPYRYSQSEQEEMERQVKMMLKSGVISPSQSPWSSPPLLIDKKDGTKRFCIDYRKLNKATVKDVHPLPLIQDALDSLKGSSFFTTLDLKSGYWQCPVRAADRMKTAFYMPNGGLYHFNVTPFGLCNAPATFARLMRIVLSGIPWTQTICYLDDVLIHSPNFDAHLKDIETVLTRIHEAGLTLNPPKCNFAAEKISYLGHDVSAKGIQPNDDNLRSIKQFPEPKCLKDVQSFLGLANYYRRFIKDFSLKAAPLTELTRKAIKFVWSGGAQEAFDGLKEQLLSKPILTHYDNQLDCEIHADASNVGLGALLLQKHPDGLHVVSYVSRGLNKAEKNYSTTEKETLAVVFAFNKFRPYLMPRPFTVVTDHHSLCFLMKKDRLADRLARWAMQLQAYNFNIIYKSGKKHMDADCLSRYPTDPPREEELFAALCPVVEKAKPSIDLKLSQMDDVRVMKFVSILKRYELATAREKKQVTNYTLINGILYKRKHTPLGPKLVVFIPKSLRQEILYACHDDAMAGHLGFHKTLDRIRYRYYFPKMSYYVRRYVQSCPDCQSKKLPAVTPAGLLQPLAVGEPFERVGIDLLGPFPRSAKGMKYIIVATEYCTRYAITAALPDATAVEVADFFVKSIVTKFGAPRELLSDRGRQFTSAIMTEVLSLLNTKSILTTAYHAQTNGLTEHLNRTISVMLSMYVDTKHTDWDQALDFVTFAYNSSVHSTTRFTPFFLMYGREPLTPLEVLFNVPTLGVTNTSLYAKLLTDRLSKLRQMARDNIEQSQLCSEQYYNRKRRAVTFEVGDLVSVYFPTRSPGLAEKLLHRYHGPYRIVDVKSALVYEVELVIRTKGKRKKPDTVHVSRLKPYVNRLDVLEELEASTDEETYVSADDDTIESSDNESINSLKTHSDQSTEEYQILEDDVHDLEAPTPPKRGKVTFDHQVVDKGTTLGMPVLEPVGLAVVNNDPNESLPSLSVQGEVRTDLNSQQLESRTGSKEPEEEVRIVPRRSKRQTKLSPPVPFPLNEDEQAEEDGAPVAPRRSQRLSQPPKRYGTSALLIRSIFLFVTIATSAAHFNKVSPVVWKQTNIPVITGESQMSLVVRYESPCTLFQNSTDLTTQARDHFSNWCNAAFDTDVMLPLREFCTTFDMAKVDATKHLLRPKRLEPITMAIGGIVIGAISTIGVGGWSLSSSFGNGDKIASMQTAIDKMIGRLEQMAHNDETIKRSLEVIEKNLEKTAITVRDNQQILQQIMGTLPKTVVLVSHLSAEFVNAKNILRETGRRWKAKQLDPNILTYFNLTTPCDDTCPVERMIPVTCHIDELRQVIQFNVRARRTEPAIQVVQADPFTLLSFRPNDNLACRHRYIGPKIVLFREQSDCVTPLLNSDIDNQGIVLHTLANYCIDPERPDTANKYWEESTCVRTEDLHADEKVQIKVTQHDLYIYCPKGEITVYNRLLQCPNHIFALPPSAPFKIGQIEYNANELTINKDYSLLPLWNHKINFHVMPSLHLLELDGMAEIKQEINRINDLKQDGLGLVGVRQYGLWTLLLVCLVAIGVTIIIVTYVAKKKTGPLVNSYLPIETLGPDIELATTTTKPAHDLPQAKTKVKAVVHAI